MNPRVHASWLCLLLGFACSRTAPAPAPAPITQVQTAHESYKHHAPGRVVAVGDLHGDLAVTRRVLQSAGASDSADHWRGGTLTLVLTGDTIDRGDDDRAVLDLLERLHGEAQQAGGAVLTLCGNHEVMNVAGDLRYVSEKSAAAFESGRAQAFAPGSGYARKLASWPIALQVDRSVFVHGGLLPAHVRYGLDRLNTETAAWMRGERAAPEALLREDAPIWTRLYSTEESEPGPEICEQLQQVLSALGAERMVVGHTPQAHGIGAACGGRVWRIDTGMSHFYGGKPQWLEIVGGQVDVHDAARE